MSTITKRLSVDQYEAMVKHGILPETNRWELIEGRLVEKDVKSTPHSFVTGLCLDALSQSLPAGWHVRKEDPVRIPNRKSEPEPDLSVVRGKRTDYLDRHPGPADVDLVVEVTRSSVAKDRRGEPRLRGRARVYGPGGIPVYWIVNVPKRRLEVYANPIGGVYLAPKVLEETESVSLVIDGQKIGTIAVADLLPPANGAGA